MSATRSATHRDFGRVNYTVHNMSGSPDAQVEQTITLMHRMVAEDCVRPEFIEWAISITAGCLSQDDICNTIWHHVSEALQFHNDDKTSEGIDALIDHSDVVEVIIRPLDMMGYVKQGIARGDCDDYSMYAAALLKARGVDYKFATVAANPADTSQYTHVYCVAYPLVGDCYDGGNLNPFKKTRVPMDTSHGEYCGWEVPNKFGKFREWGAEDSWQWVATTAWVGLGVGLVWAVLKGFGK